MVIRPARIAPRSGKDTALVPIRTLLHIRGMPAIFIASVVTVTALDLLVIYMPALGAERQIDATNIGLLLTVRSAAVAGVADFLFPPDLRGRPRAADTGQHAGQRRGVRRGGDAAAAAGDVCHHGGARVRHGHRVDTDPLGRHVLAPPGSYGTALTMRMTGNRLGQVMFPALAGVVAAAIGVGGIFVIIGLGIGVSGIAVPLSLRSIGGPDA